MRIKLILILFLANVFFVFSKGTTNLLQSNFIWSTNTDVKGEFTVFRKTFEVDKPESAVINIFADTRYILWINGVEVLRGPCRFDPKSPQYDSMNVSQFLKSGKNCIAVLVMARGSNGKMMSHVPGLTVLLNSKVKGKNHSLKTDETWRWNNKTRFMPAHHTWGYTCDRIDARKDDGDWTLVDYDDSKWNNAIRIDGNQWGKLVPRQIPLLGLWDIPLKLLNGKQLPYQIQKDKSLILETKRMVQGYAAFTFEASEGDSLIFEVGYTTDSSTITTKYNTANIYIAKQGKQQYVTTDSYGFRYIKVSSKNNPVTLLDVKVTDRRYPFHEAGSFECNDGFLNELWKRASLTMLMNSEDGFMDCALREKAEWLGDAAVVQYPVSRVLYGYPDAKGVVKSDAGLMKNMILHVAQSMTDSGTLKAHHPSDRWDIHGYIEDYSMLWVMSLRQVFDNTGDKKLVQEVWMPLKRQMQWFLDYRSSKTGLLYAREFVIFDNPLAYIYCEGGTLNAFLYKALIDATYLSKIMGDKPAEKLYKQAAVDLFESYNKHLWIEQKQTYSAGIAHNRQLLPTLHTAMLALYMGVVPDNRMPSVQNYFLQNYNNKGGKTRIKEKGKLLEAAYDHNVVVGSVSMPYTAMWLLSNLYSLNKDTLALNYIREKWASSLRIEQTGTLTESFGGSDLCHNFGSSAAYFLSSNVLGVSVSLPLTKKEIIFKPQMGDLIWAKGNVVTEHGVINVDISQQAGTTKYQVNAPKGIKLKVILPEGSAHNVLLINGVAK